MARNESFFLAGPTGRLEAILGWPETTPIAAAVVCHADPSQGGVMHFKTIFRIAKALQGARVAVLRFNFRGVGLSEGVHDRGRGEVGDAREALDELSRRFPSLPLLAGGFSFGSVVSCRLAAVDPRVRALVALGFPVVRVADPSFLKAIRAPRLFVQGENDVFGGAHVIRPLVEALPQPRSLVVVPEADHFFTGKLDALQTIVTEWAGGRPWDMATR